MAWKVLDPKDRVLAAFDGAAARTRADAERDHLVAVHGWLAEELRVVEVDDEPAHGDPDLEEA